MASSKRVEIERVIFQYFPSFRLIKQWETADKHLLAIIEYNSKDFVFKSPYPYSLSANYSRSYYSLNATAQYLEKCNKKNILVPFILKNKSEKFITRVNRKRFAYIVPYIQHSEKVKWDKTYFKKLAEIHAQLHNVSIEVVFPRLKRHKLCLVDFLSNIKKLSKLDTKFARSLLLRGEKELAYLKANFERLPNGICHNDISKGNVLINTKNKLITVIDFDFSDQNLFAVDIGRTMASFCVYPHSVFSENELQFYINAYRKYRNITQQEIRIIKAVLIFNSYPIFAYIQKKLSEDDFSEFIRKIDSLI